MNRCPDKATKRVGRLGLWKAQPASTIQYFSSDCSAPSSPLMFVTLKEVLVISATVLSVFSLSFLCFPINGRGSIIEQLRPTKMKFGTISRRPSSTYWPSLPLHTTAWRSVVWARLLLVSSSSSSSSSSGPCALPFTRPEALRRRWPGRTRARGHCLSKRRVGLAQLARSRRPCSIRTDARPHARQILGPLAKPPPPHTSAPELCPLDVKAMPAFLGARHRCRCHWSAVGCLLLPAACCLLPTAAAAATTARRGRDSTVASQPARSLGSCPALAARTLPPLWLDGRTGRRRGEGRPQARL